MTATMTETMQRPLPLIVPTSQPLVTMDTIRARLAPEGQQAVDSETVLALLDDGQIWAVNIASDGAGKRELRFWSGRPEATEEQRVAACLLTTPERLREAHTMATTRLESAWVTTDHHIRRLIAGGELKGVREGRVWRVCRVSAAEFLESRVVGKF